MKKTEESLFKSLLYPVSVLFTIIGIIKLNPILVFISGIAVIYTKKTEEEIHKKLFTPNNFFQLSSNDRKEALNYAWNGCYKESAPLMLKANVLLSNTIVMKILGFFAWIFMISITMKLGAIHETIHGNSSLNNN